MDACHRLIRAGHRDVGGYTIAQARAFLAAEGRAERLRQRDTLVLLRASRLDRSGFEAALRELTE